MGEQFQPGRGRFDRQQLHDSPRGVHLKATLQQGDGSDGKVLPHYRSGNQRVYPLNLVEANPFLVVGVDGLVEQDPHPLLQLL